MGLEATSHSKEWKKSSAESLERFSLYPRRGCPANEYLLHFVASQRRGGLEWENEKPEMERAPPFPFSPFSPRSERRKGERARFMTEGHVM